jgi:hypothetical protein
MDTTPRIADAELICAVYNHLGDLLGVEG